MGVRITVVPVPVGFLAELLIRKGLRQERKLAHASRIYDTVEEGSRWQQGACVWGGRICNGIVYDRRCTVRIIQDTKVRGTLVKEFQAGFCLISVSLCVICTLLLARLITVSIGLWAGKFQVRTCRSDIFLDFIITSSVGFECYRGALCPMPRSLRSSENFNIIF